MGSTLPNNTPSEQYTQTRYTTGEMLLPMLLAALEACWIAVLLVGLSSASIIPHHQTFLPLWAPFVLELVPCALALIFPTKRHKNRQTTLHIAGIVIITLLVLWGEFYFSTETLFSLHWITALLRAIITFGATTFITAVAIITSCYLYIRGIHWSRQGETAPETVARMVKIGVPLFIAVLLIQTLAHLETLSLFILLPIFFTLVLFARALSNMVYVRDQHINSPQRFHTGTERLLLTMIGSICIALIFIVIVVGLFTSSTFLASVQAFLSPVGVLLDWIARGFAVLVVIISTPFFLIFSRFHPQGIKIPQVPLSTIQITHNPGAAASHTASASTVLIILLFVIAFLIILGVLIRMLLRILRPNTNKQTRQRQIVEVHESLWSWQLFWQQFKMWLSHLMRRKKQATAQTPVQANEGLEEREPIARTVRTIYRAFLQQVARYGYKRERFETPHELLRRLAPHFPMAQQEIHTITDIYASTRYGNRLPEEEEIQRIQQDWEQFQQKLHINTTNQQ
jgi:hypothetical protein